MGGILLRKKLIAVAGVVISISLITGSMYQLKATTIKEEKDKQEELHKKIESANQILGELETLKNDTTAYINALDDRMGEIVAYIVDLNGQIADKESEIEQINKDLATQEEDIGSQYQAMKLRIQFLYENGHTEYLDMILNSKSIGDMLNKAEYLSKITEYDRNMLNKMRETKTVIENTKARLETGSDGTGRGRCSSVCKGAGIAADKPKDFRYSEQCNLYGERTCTFSADRS